MTDVVICGMRGRMGGALVDLIGERDDMRVTGGVGRTSGAGGAGGALPVMPPAAARELLHAADVVLDFSSAAGTRALLENAGDALDGRALVSGTTALDAHTQRLLDDLARRAAVLTAANFSLGVNLLALLVERAAVALRPELYDVEIVEAHHAGKVDAPSGTALVLGTAIARGRGRELADVRCDGRRGSSGARAKGEVGFHAVRGGGTIGDHSVLFLGARERLELRHEALDRALFAEGALAAARWIAGRGTGRYSMSDVLGL